MQVNRIGLRGLNMIVEIKIVIDVEDTPCYSAINAAKNQLRSMDFEEIIEEIAQYTIKDN